jgi:hypothetical protein
MPETKVQLTDTRSVHAPVVMPDVELEHWAGVYTATPLLYRRGVSFEAFLAAPVAILAAHTRGLVITIHGRDVKSLPPHLEAALAALAAAAMKDLQGYRWQHGRLFQKMKHHRWPRGRSAFWPKAGA